MAFCRWSSDGGRSDVYCYESEEGFITHVAEKARCIPRDLRPPSWDLIEQGRYDEWKKQEDEYRRRLNRLKAEKIGLPYDGRSFCDPTLEAMLARLLMLRDVGYHVPEDALEGIREELDTASRIR